MKENYVQQKQFWFSEIISASTISDFKPLDAVGIINNNTKPLFPNELYLLLKESKMFHRLMFQSAYTLKE